MKSISTRKKTGYRMACPHCRGTLHIQTNREVTLIFRQQEMECVDIEWGTTLGAELSITQGISPSLSPDRKVQLGMAGPRRRSDNDND